jgi:hypothetical protein
MGLSLSRASLYGPPFIGLTSPGPPFIGLLSIRLSSIGGLTDRDGEVGHDESIYSADAS